jgi:hypothetical protein
MDRLLDELRMYESIKKELLGHDYNDIKMQSSYRKLRHHLDQMILHLQKLVD